MGRLDGKIVGVTNKVVPDGRLPEQSVTWAAHMAGWPGWALAACKRSLIEGRDLPLSAARRNEVQIFRNVSRREDLLHLIHEAQAKRDAGADSYQALGFERS